MGLKKTVYSVLILSSAENFTASLSALLSPAEYAPLCCAESVSAAKRLTNERQFDFVIINSPLPDENGMDFACRLSEKSDSAILLFARADVFSAAYEKLTPFGVFTLNKPVARDMAMTALLWLAAARERLRKNEQKSISIEEKMKEIRTVNRAKWLLIEREGMSETEAHRHIEKLAMDRCLPKSTIAGEIIENFSER